MKFKDHRESHHHPCRGEETEAQRKEEGYQSSESKYVPKLKFEPVS